MRVVRTLMLGVLGTLAASGAFAMFRAADLVIVPVGASLPGLYGSIWKTDLEIMNVDAVPIDVEIVILQCCSTDNTAWFNDITNHLGGRTEDGFGKIDAKLKDIPPGRAVDINDVVGTDLGLTSTKGALLIFAYEANSFLATNPPGGHPRLIIVNSRSYSYGTDSTGKPLTYGQQVPGLPWHDYIDPGKKARGLDEAVFTGLREDSAFRSAIGLVNVSDELTNIDVELTLNGQDGTQIGQQFIALPPLAHEQFDQAIINLFGKALTDQISGATLSVIVDSYTSGSLNPTPGLIAYVSRIDNNTNDPIYIEQSFTKAFPWDCIFNGNCTSVASGLKLSPTTAPAVPPHLRPPTRLSRLVR